MMRYDNFIKYLSELCSEIGVSDLNIDQRDSGEVIFSEEINGLKKSILVSLKPSEYGCAIGSVSLWLNYSILEKLIELVAKESQLNYDKTLERTFTYSAIDSKAYRYLTTKEHEIEKLKELITTYIKGELNVFLENKSSIEGLGEFLLKNDFENVLNVGIGGEYPLNILKAIAIAKLCGREDRFREYLDGFQKWINEDRNDPEFANACDSHQIALEVLSDKLRDFTSH